MALTPKQQRFVEEFCVDGNATQAYMRAGYTATGHAAEVNASRLMRNAEVGSAIAVAQAARSERTEITADWVLQRLKAEATNYGEESSHAARVAALKVIAQCKGMLVNKTEITGGVTLELTERIVDGSRQKKDD